MPEVMVITGTRKGIGRYGALTVWKGRPNAAVWPPLPQTRTAPALCAGAVLYRWLRLLDLLFFGIELGAGFTARFARVDLRR